MEVREGEEEEREVVREGEDEPEPRVVRDGEERKGDGLRESERSEDNAETWLSSSELRVWLRNLNEAVYEV